MKLFERLNPTAKVESAAKAMADVLQEEGVFGLLEGQSLENWKKDFVTQVIYSAKKGRPLELTYPNDVRLDILVVKFGNQFGFAAITALPHNRKSEVINYERLNLRLHEVLRSGEREENMYGDS